LLRGRALHSKYNSIRWHHNNRWFEAWCKGTTGFPIVDAGMRQLNTTGYMHNRARLITMTFLIKIMMIDWREGEKYFAQHLVDYDPASNNGNTLWVMGGGADSMPWFRYFNPWIQTEEHDPDCEYIREWIPELRDVPTKDILKWETEWASHTDCKYPKPILDYAEQKQKSIQMYKNAL
jgi:deoxyribodipyrimidine photo-lyase